MVEGVHAAAGKRAKGGAGKTVTSDGTDPEYAESLLLRREIGDYLSKQGEGMDALGCAALYCVNLSACLHICQISAEAASYWPSRQTCCSTPPRS